MKKKPTMLKKRNKSSALGFGKAKKRTMQESFQKGLKKPVKKKPLTPAQKRRIKVLGAKATTAKAKARVAKMDKDIKKIKKKK